jgi:hypothetical protein
MLHVPRVHLTKVKTAKGETHPLVLSSEMLLKDYDRKGSFEKKSFVVNFKGLGVKTNSLAVNHQSQSDSDSEVCQYRLPPSLSHSRHRSATDHHRSR